MRSGFTTPKATARFPPKATRKQHRQSSRGTDSVFIICCVVTRSNRQPSFGAPILLPEKVKSSCQAVSIDDYDISNDEKEVVFSTQPPGQPSQIWIAPLDRSAPPRRIAANGEGLPHFGPNHEIVFRLTDGQANYVGAMAARRNGPAQSASRSESSILTLSRPIGVIVSVTAVAPNVDPAPKSHSSAGWPAADTDLQQSVFAYLVAGRAVLVSANS